MVTKVYHKTKTPKASFALVHGICEHSGRYLGIAKALADENFVVHMVDLTGFGVSGGPRSGADFTQMQDDIAYLLKQVDESLPLFLMGHSMGGGIFKK